ncbi:MAG: class I SAM-dependent methyltransferase [Hyphomicrobiales bacterium]|nr:class I SAM-dependent methyltransferase [Hyphomicrobiales bacterium]MBV8824517.1 class I SAM-dependent methyltransferase [Hyphomicrobiales bacterium]
MPGFVDILNDVELAGWSVKADNGEADWVAIYIGDQQIARIFCNLPRPDVQAAGIGRGQGGFRYFFPDDRHLTNKVGVRSLSTGEEIPVTKTCLDSLSFRTRPWLNDAFFAEDIYALAPISLVADPIGDRAPRVTKTQINQLTFTAQVLAPRGAVIGIVPAEADIEGLTVAPIATKETPIRELPSSAPSIREIEFRFSVTMPTARRYIAFHLIDQSPNSPCFGEKPVNPVASLCAPLGDDWLVAPNQQNVERTCGDCSLQLFRLSGVTAAYQIRSLAQKFLAGQAHITILDWGVGCARVAAPLKRAMMPDARVLGVDVDGVNVNWCKENVSDIHVALADFFPPLEIDTASVDLIYGISVMTHLTEGAQLAWLKELRRILKPGGICILSTHGNFALAKANYPDPSVAKQIHQRGITDIVPDSNLGSKLNLRDYYRATFQTRRQVEEQWSYYLKIVAYYPAGFHALQDIVILRKE